LKFPLLPKLPGIGNGDNVKVTHGVDTQARRAWVRAIINVPLTDKATIFSFGPVELKLANANFTAEAMIPAELGSCSHVPRNNADLQRSGKDSLRHFDRQD
jgi:hypothetical protein